MRKTTPRMRLVRALRLSSAPKIAFVGSGGKTTIIFSIAHQLPTPVIITTTTHLALEQTALADYHYKVDLVDEADQVFYDLPKKVLLMTSRATEKNRVIGLSPSIVDHLFSLTQIHNLPLLIEADGSQLRPLKAPAEHEPEIPQLFFQQSMVSGKIDKQNMDRKQPGLDAVVVVVGLSGVGRPISPDWVHRPEQFASLAGLNPGDPITIQALARVLMHPNGGIKNIPTGIRRVALLNQADTLEDQSLARQLASALLPTYNSVVITSMVGKSTAGIKERRNTIPKSPEVIAVHEPVAGVVLAAGGSSRLGRPKQLLDWRGKLLVRHVVEKALNANLSPVIVVLGAHYQEVRKELMDLPVTLVNNEKWEQGQSTSVRAGLELIPEEVGAAIFLLVDQPRVSPIMIRSLIEQHAVSLDPIIAPMVQGKRGNPVLFDRETFADLKNLRGDIGGRSLFDHFPVSYLKVQNAQMMLDIDTEEDYQQLLQLPD